MIVLFILSLNEIVVFQFFFPSFARPCLNASDKYLKGQKMHEFDFRLLGTRGTVQVIRPVKSLSESL